MSVAASVVHTGAALPQAVACGKIFLLGQPPCDKAASTWSDAPANPNFQFEQMSDCLALRFDRAVTNANAFNEMLWDGKKFGRMIWELDEICDVIEIPPFSRFWPEESDGIWFEAEEALASMAQLMPWIMTEKRNEGTVRALSVLAGDLELAREQNARFVMYHY